MPERYPGSQPDPMLPALYDIARTLGGDAQQYPIHEHEAYGLPLPGEGQSYVTDPEMVELLEQSSQIVGPDVLNRLLEVNDPFNRTVIIHDEYGNETPDNYYGHRRFLREIPRYAETARQAGLSLSQAEEMMTHLLRSDRHPDIPSGHSQAIFLTRALEASVAAEEQLTPEDLDRLRSLITHAAADDVSERGLVTYAAGREAGLGLDASVQIIEGYLATANYRQIGYEMWRFTEALQALNVAQVDPSLTEEVFNALNREHPEYRKDSYSHLKDTLEILCPVQGLTPSDLMQNLVNNLRAGLGFDDALGRIIDESPALPASGDHVTVVVPAEERNRYFPAQQGALKHAVLPYQTQRPLNEGLRDLEELTMANSQRGDVVSEGRWAFDRDTNTWYSLGGSTTYIPSGARHTAIAYDLSKLSDRPNIFHIHPNEFAISADKYGFVFPSNSDYRSMATILTDAERPISPRSFISHPMGVTEFVFPDDPARIQEVAEGFQEMRDALFNRFGRDSRDIQDAALRMGEQAFVEMMVRDVNARLPAGFAIKLHPHGVDLERLMNEE